MERILELAEKLVRIRSVSRDKRALCEAIDLCLDYLDKTDTKVKVYNVNGKMSMVATLRDTVNPKVFFIGHVDVVDPFDVSCFEPRRENGNLYGTGTLDMKGMVAVLLNLMRDYSIKENKPDIGLILSSDEEIGGKDGVDFLVNSKGYRCGLAIAGEPTGLRITTREKGVLWLELECRGRSAHGSTPFLGDNPIYKLARGIEELVGEFNIATDSEFWQTSFSVGYLHSGSQDIPNRIPREATAVIDARYTTPEDKKRLLDAIKKRGIEIKRVILDTGGPAITEPKGELIDKLYQAVQDVIGKAEYSDARFFSDAGFFARAGIPAVCFGPVGKGLHSNKEYVSIESLRKARDTIYRFVDSIM